MNTLACNGECVNVLLEARAETRLAFPLLPIGDSLYRARSRSSEIR